MTETFQAAEDQLLAPVTTRSGFKTLWREKSTAGFTELHLATNRVLKLTLGSFGCRASGLRPARFSWLAVAALDQHIEYRKSGWRNGEPITFEYIASGIAQVGFV